MNEEILELHQSSFEALIENDDVVPQGTIAFLICVIVLRHVVDCIQIVMKRGKMKRWEMERIVMK